MNEILKKIEDIQILIKKGVHREIIYNMLDGLYSDCEDYKYYTDSKVEELQDNLESAYGHIFHLKEKNRF